MTVRHTNWAGNVTYRPPRIHRPSSPEELQHLVATSESVHALGAGHSFNDIADSRGELVTVADLPPTIDIDTDRATVTVAAGITYADLGARLQAAGWALPNLASLPHISVAGACATGTHGSGNHNGSLSSAVSSMELVTADGEIVTVRRDTDGDHFRGCVVALGALGIVTRLTLDIVPAFGVRQYVYDGLPRGQLDRHLDEIFASGYSVSLFTDWTGQHISQVWLKRRVEEDDSWIPPLLWLDATLADEPRHPVRRLPAINCTQQLGVPGPWHERLPHFRPEFTPSTGDELQSEYLVPRRHAIEALAAVDGVRDLVANVLLISEIRTVASDDLWLSPCYQRDSLAIHFTWIKDAEAVALVLEALEERLAPFEARPHWGKVFLASRETLAHRYERLADFRQLMQTYDPTGKFRNDFLDRVVVSP